MPTRGAQFPRSLSRGYVVARTGSIDLVTVGAAIHWTIPEATVRAAATVLRPGGTLAIWYYSGHPYFAYNPEADEVFNEVMERWGKESKHPGSESEKSLFISNTELDCVPLPEDLFERGARRIKINVRGPVGRICSCAE